MRTKGQVFETFQKFICQAKRQFEKKLKHLHPDFGAKFANQVFEKYIAKKSIQ